MSGHGQTAATQSDRNAADHFPACPKCGDLCGKLARICASCGTRLFDPDTDRRLVSASDGGDDAA